MEIVNNSTIDSVIDFANVKFGLEIKKDDISEQLKGLSFGDTLKLLDAIKKDDNDIFSSIIDLSRVNEAGYGTIQTAKPSNATIRASNNGNDQRDFTNAQQDAKRDSYAIARKVAGAPPQGPIVATGQGASRVGNADPDDIHRADIEGQTNANAQAGARRDQEIERLKQLAMGGR